MIRILNHLADNKKYPFVLHCNITEQRDIL